MQHVNLLMKKDAIVVPIANPLVVLIYDHSTQSNQAYRAFSEVYANAPNVNFFLINADKDPLAHKLVKKIPSVFGFKNHMPLGYLMEEPSPRAIYKFWETVYNYNAQALAPTETSPPKFVTPDKAKDISPKNNYETYKTFQF